MTDVAQQAPGLLDWMTSAPHGNGVHFATEDGWDFWTYARLADLVRTAAARMHADGVRPGDRVAVVAATGPSLVGALFGALYAGATPSSVPHPFAFVHREQYDDHVGHLLRAGDPQHVLHDELAADAVTRITSGMDLTGVRPVVTQPGPEGADERSPGVPDLALVQFTSGSSGHSRGVRISRSNLEQNLWAMRRWLGWTEQTRGLSWLPSHHDMGLVGCLINSVVAGSPLWIMQPDQFIRSPLRYLQAIAEHRIELSAMPNFGLEFVMRRVPTDQGQDLDLSSLRALVLGAERIDADLLARFSDRFAEQGLSPTCLVPAYGGAEMTLAATGVRPGEPWLTAPPADDGAAVMGCGRPLPGVSVRVVDDAGQDVPEGSVGEIVVSGPGVSPGYVAAADTGASGTAITGGDLRSGDAGFLRDGELFVIGRFGDGIKAHGRMVFAEALEAELSALGLPGRRTAVLLGELPGTALAVVLVVRPGPDWETRIRRRLAGVLPASVEVRVVEIEQQQLLVTSSGKPRRRPMWSAYTQRPVQDRELSAV